MARAEARDAPPKGCTRISRCTTSASLVRRRTPMSLDHRIWSPAGHVSGHVTGLLRRHVRNLPRPHRHHGAGAARGIGCAFQEEGSPFRNLHRCFSRPPFWRHDARACAEQVGLATLHLHGCHAVRPAGRQVAGHSSDERISTTPNGLASSGSPRYNRRRPGRRSSPTAIYDSSKTFDKTLSAPGLFPLDQRQAQSEAYEIQTPAGTIGIRAWLDIWALAPRPQLAAALSGRARFCGSNACRGPAAHLSSWYSAASAMRPASSARDHQTAAWTAPCALSSRQRSRRPVEPTSCGPSGGSTRDRWRARCRAQGA